jgi:hypothetical protein
MEFDIERCYSAINADELKIGSKVILADNLWDLKTRVSEENCITILTEINQSYNFERFVDDSHKSYVLAYLVELPKEKVLKWTDLKIGDIIRQKDDARKNISFMVLGIDDDKETESHILVHPYWINDKELMNWEKVKYEKPLSCSWR